MKSAPWAQGDLRLTDPELVQTLSIRRLVVTASCISIFAVSCSTDVPESIAFADDSTTIERPETLELTGEELELITFHANWICELQRRTFDSLGDADVARSEALGLASIDAAIYEDFLRVALGDQIIRDAVLFEYQQHCRAE